MIGILAIDPRTGVISTQVRKPFFLLPPRILESRLRKGVMERQKLRESRLSWPGVLGLLC